jgi:menaquinone-specific isochorismate synthase
LRAFNSSAIVAQIFMASTCNSLAWLTRRDGSVLIGHGPFTAAAEAPAGGVAFYVRDFALQDRLPWKIPGRVERTRTSELATRITGPARLQSHWNPLDATPFSLVFQEVMASIHAGVFEKTVPVVTETGTAGFAPGPAILAAMARQGMPLQSYGWMEPESGFAGATPELLFSLHGRQLETMALAGTARSEDRDVFAVDAKEIREHEYVAQTLVSKLLNLGRLERRDRMILDLGPIVHFLTPIHVDLHAHMAPEDLLQRLHPTPALGPLPRTDGTMEKLLEWRKRLGCPTQFGAPFGLLDDQRFDAIVAIRGVWWQANHLSIPAGCGIIEASRLVNEWRELRLKREAVKRFLDLP